MMFEIVIEKVVYGGAGLGRHEGKVVFVPFACPGDRLLVRVARQKKNLIWAAIEKILESGPDRIAPPCVHFGSCGGCQWQHIRYPAQVEAKHLLLMETFHHHFPETRQLSISMKPSPEILGYRSRARIQISGPGSHSAIGFFGARSHAVVDVPMCPLFRSPLNEALAFVRERWKEGRMNPAARQVELACSVEDEKWGWAESEYAGEENFTESCMSGFPEMQAELLTRRIGNCEYRVAPSLFFQANDFMVPELVAAVLGLLPPAEGSSALDLYSGVGLFSLPLAGRFREITAVEASPGSSRMCAENALRAGITNLRTVCSEVSAWMKTISSQGSPAYDLVVLDPPRTGAGPAVMDCIREWAPETIIYVACDPQTLVRDLAVFRGREYRIDSVQGLDLFPQTYHFETVVGLKRC